MDDDNIYILKGCTDDDAHINCEVIAECEYTVENTIERREESKRRRIFGIPIQCPIKVFVKWSIILKKYIYLYRRR